MNKKLSILVLISIATMMFTGCNSKNAETHSRSENAGANDVPSSITQKAKESGKSSIGSENVSTNDVQSSITEKAKESGNGMIDLIRSWGEKIAASNKNVEVYSLPLLPQTKTCMTIPVVFHRDDPVANMRDFIEVVNEISEQIFIKPKLEDKMMGIFLGFAPDGEAVCGLSMYPQEQVFSLEGIDFTSEKAAVYRQAFNTLVKNKTGKTNICEWDCFIFRSMKPSKIEDLSDMGERTVTGVAGTTIISLYKLESGIANLLLSNKNMLEQIFSASSESNDSKAIMKTGFPVSTVWFDGSGKRIMAEMARQLPDGKIRKERKWYNGYSMPQ
ncbi:MAG: hypothetical protein LBL07_03620 [Tannerella sp.]|jgi:hypothetical protein|nr:hypothetical protein [Tannerella sp.]